MPPFYTISIVLVMIAQVALPRRYAFIPLIIAGAHLGSLEVLPELTPARLVTLLGLMRALFGGFLVPKKRSGLDTTFIVFSAIALLSTFGHVPDEWTPSPFAERVGLILNVVGTYLYGRAYLPDIASVRRYAFILPIVLIPLAICMTLEKQSGRNLYSNLGIASADSMERGDRIRATGSFKHPILAGCAGATALPFALLLWRSRRKTAALVAAGALMAITLSCSSSGPLAAVGVTMGAIVLWRYRERLSLVLKLGVLMAIVYSIGAGRGPWYMMASIDLVGGSTGWHRAKLIDQGYTYLNEWWLFGTDYTRHWMSSGMSRYPNHVDVTNYYLKLGVMGGLPLTLSLVAMLVVSYKQLVKRMVTMRDAQDENEIVLWCVGASIATHAVSFISIAYFDQMYVFFFLLLGAVPGLLISDEDQSPQESEEKPLEANPA